jgi:hypothetical protein
LAGTRAGSLVAASPDPAPQASPTTAAQVMGAGGSCFLTSAPRRRHGRHLIHIVCSFLVFTKSSINNAGRVSPVRFGQTFLSPWFLQLEIIKNDGCPWSYSMINPTNLACDCQGKLCKRSQSSIKLVTKYLIDGHSSMSLSFVGFPTSEPRPQLSVCSQFQSTPSHPHHMHLFSASDLMEPSSKILRLVQPSSAPLHLIRHISPESALNPRNRLNQRLCTFRRAQHARVLSSLTHVMFDLISIGLD